MKRYLPFVIIIIVLVVALGAGVLMYRSALSQNQTLSQPTASPSATPATTPQPGVVLLEEYGDYQCPPCGAMHPELKKLKSEFGDRLRFEFHHFPLAQIHAHAVEASQAAAAAGLQGRFKEMHDLLYENQKLWSDVPDARPIFVSLARQAGLNVDQFIRDFDGPRVNAIISTDVQRGLSLGVNSTPTLFLDGQMMQAENQTYDYLRAEISRRLHR
ncbi:MAG: thioredoxin domain-containing protein [Blastocatellia bacterium]